MKKRSKFKITRLLLGFLIFFALGFYNTYEYLLPSSIQASIYKKLGRIYDEDKSVGNYAIKVEAIELTNKSFEGKDLYILEYSGDASDWNTEEIKTIFDVPVDYQVDYMLKYDVDAEEILNIDIEKIRQYYLERHNRGLIMLVADQKDRHIEEIYANKNNLKEKDYYIAAKIIPRYIDGYNGKVDAIPQGAADIFYDVATKYRKNFSEDLGNVSVEVYARADLGNIGYVNATLGILFYVISLSYIYKIFKDRGDRKLEEEGIWEKVNYEERSRRAGKWW